MIFKSTHTPFSLLGLSDLACESIAASTVVVVLWRALVGIIIWLHVLVVLVVLPTISRTSVVPVFSVVIRLVTKVSMSTGLRVVGTFVVFSEVSLIKALVVVVIVGCFLSSEYSDQLHGKDETRDGEDDEPSKTEPQRIKWAEDRFTANVKHGLDDVQWLLALSQVIC